MEGNASSTTAVTTTDENRNEAMEFPPYRWADVILPIVSAGLLILWCIILSRQFGSLCKGPCCSSDARPQNENSRYSSNNGEVNSDYQSESEDFPPNYSAVTRQESISAVSFRVVADDNCDFTNLSWQSERNDPPNYFEIINQKRNRSAELEQAQETNTNAIFSNVSGNEHHRTAVESSEMIQSNLPPPYLVTSTSRF